MKQIKIPANLEGLMQAAEQILPKKTRKVVLNVIRTRIKWQIIQDEFNELREFGAREAIQALSEKHHYSVQSIERIVYGEREGVDGYT